MHCRCRRTSGTSTAAARWFPASMVVAATAALTIALGLVIPAEADAVVPGGNGRITFVIGRGGSNEIATMNPDGSGQRQLTSDPADDMDPAYSPDGTRVAFSRSGPRGGDFGNWNVHIMNADGSGDVALTSEPGYDGEPTFSPNGRQIVYVHENDVWVMDTDGGNRRQLTSGNELDDAPSFSPDGTTIAFNRSLQIWLMDASGASQRQLTSTGVNRHAAFSPDGRSMAFTSVRDGNNEVYVMAADGTGQKRLTFSAPDARSNIDSEPAFSPDGSRIAFTSDRNVAPQIFSMRPDGSEQVALTRSPDNGITADWAVGAGSPPPAQTGCADVTVYGMPGSGQGRVQGQDSRFGTQVGAVLGVLRQQLRNRGVTADVRFDSIDYPAILVPNYFQSKDLGYANAYEKVKTRSTRCTSERYVLVGYSQSAHVLGDLTATILRGGGPLPISRLLGVALVADPAFEPASPAPTITRIDGGFGSGLAGRRAPWPADAPVRSVCIARDAVCDNYGRVVPDRRVFPFVVGAQMAAQQLGKIHTNGYLTKTWPGSTKTVPEYLGGFLADRIAAGR